MNQDHQDRSDLDDIRRESVPQDLGDALTSLEEGILNTATDAPSQELNKEQQENLQRLLEGKYRIESFLGRGACAAVYLVTNLNLDRKEALKVMAETQDSPREFSHRFKQEAKISASLEHPNIVQVYDFGQTPYGFCYTMQYVEGPTLSQALRKEGVWDQRRVAKLALPLLDALDYSHSKGVIHRDIKPSNVLLDAHGTPFLTDFGIAKTMGGLLKTRTGKFLGTPIYVAPEQISAAELDGRADLYALGVTLYEVLTQNYPFPFNDPVQVVMSRLFNPPRPPSEFCPEIDPAFEAILLRALEKNPKDRFASASEMYDAIVRFLRQDPEDDRPVVHRRARSRPVATRALDAKAAEAPASNEPRTPVPLPRKKETNSWPWIAAALVLAVLVGVFTLPRRSRPDRAPSPQITEPAESSPVDSASTLSSGPDSEGVDAAALSEAAAEIQDEIDQKPHESEEKVTQLPSADVAGDVEPRQAAQPAAPMTQQIVPKRVVRRVPVQPPQLVKTVQPEINDDSFALCKGEIVSISLVIDEVGHVVKARILSSGHPEGCAEIVKQAAMRYTYDPALDVNGDPIQATIAIAIEL